MTAADNEELDALVAELELVGTEYRAAREGVAAINALRARIAELEQEAKQMREYFQHNHEVESNLNARAELAESQLRQVKADAERYRWLCEHSVGPQLFNAKPNTVNVQFWNYHGGRVQDASIRAFTPHGWESISAAIDAARRNDGTA